MTGRLEIICGPMFAGKSTELIRRLREARHAQLDVAVFKPETDTRSGAASIRTHPGDRLDALPLKSASRLIEAIPSADRGLVVGVDEAHFFGSELIAPVRELLRRGNRVILAGVERDHRGQPFEPFPTLLCEADEVVKMAAVCGVCGGPAVHSQRLVRSDAAIVVGGAESYQARCRRCFEPG